MFKSLHRFLIRNIDNIIYILFMIKTFLICSNLEKIMINILLIYITIIFLVIFMVLLVTDYYMKFYIV